MAPATQSVHRQRIIYVQPVHAELAWGRDDGILELAVAGDLCTWSSAMFRPVVLDLIASDAPSRVHLDLADVAFIDARGVALLLAARALVAETGGALVISTSDAVQRVLDLCGVGDDAQLLPVREGAVS